MHRAVAEVPYCERGHVWMVSFDPPVGHEQAKIRPAMVISPDPSRIIRAEMVMLVPITSRGRLDLWSRVPIAPPEGGLVIPGHVVAEQLRTVSTQRLLRLMGQASESTVLKVLGVVRGMLGLS